MHIENMGSPSFFNHINLTVYSTHCPFFPYYRINSSQVALINQQYITQHDGGTDRLTNGPVVVHFGSTLVCFALRYPRLSCPPLSSEISLASPPLLDLGLHEKNEVSEGQSPYMVSVTDGEQLIDVEKGYVRGYCTHRLLKILR